LYQRLRHHRITRENQSGLFLTSKIGLILESASVLSWPTIKSIPWTLDFPFGKRFFSGGNFSHAPPAVDEFFRRDEITGFSEAI
jgi:hypothetical protein